MESESQTCNVCALQFFPCIIWFARLEFFVVLDHALCAQGRTICALHA